MNKFYSQKGLEKEMAKVSLDAERHRRTPRLSAISGKAIDVWVAVFYGLWPIQCATLAEIGDAGIRITTIAKQAIVYELTWKFFLNFMSKS